MATPQAPHARDDGQLVRAARQRIENHFETRHNACALAGLRVVLDCCETTQQRALRREHASMRAALNAAEAKLRELSSAAPALVARPGDAFHHARADGLGDLHPDFVVYRGRADQLGGLCSPSVAAALDGARGDVLTSPWGRWLVFEHVEGYSLPSASSGYEGGMFFAIDPEGARSEPLVHKKFNFVRAGMPCNSREFCVPPNLCAGFRRLNRQQQEFHELFHGSGEEGQESDANESFVQSEL